MVNIQRRDRFGKFNARGTYKTVNGRLVKLTSTDLAMHRARKERAKLRIKSRIRAADDEPPIPQFADKFVDKGAAKPLRGTAPTARAAARLTVTTHEPSGRTGAVFSTWFKASGTIGRNADTYNKRLWQKDHPKFAAPAAFYSNQGAIMGRVKYPGIVPLEDLIRDLNRQLQFAGEETQGFDFRNAYVDWSYTYQVVETIGPTSRVIVSKGRHA